ncbi:MAG TPA: hypothetical protein VGJ73_15625 [Verrucomicrobiae bacterium]
MPQIRRALSRGFANGGWVVGAKIPRAALADSLALGYIYIAPMGLSICGFRRRYSGKVADSWKLSAGDES